MSRLAHDSSPELRKGLNLNGDYEGSFPQGDSRRHSRHWFSTRLLQCGLLPPNGIASVFGKELSCRCPEYARPRVCLRPFDAVYARWRDAPAPLGERVHSSPEGAPLWDIANSSASPPREQ